MCVGPIFTLVLYNKLNPSWFAYAWTMVFIVAFFTVALSVPVTAIFFSTINWCCWHNKAVLPGEPRWRAEEDVGLNDETPYYWRSRGSKGFDGWSSRERVD